MNLFERLLMTLLTVATTAGLAPDATARPNIVVVLTDDQRADATQLMRNVRHRLAGPGVTFSNAFVSNPLCCPSRTSILTGRHSHTTNVWSNRPPFGSWTAFRRSGSESRTIAVALRRAGYRTAFVGKYLNHYQGPTIPPGWSEWRSFYQGWPYYDYSLNVNGRRVRYGRRTADYSTDVLGRMAAQFVRSARRPFFLLFAPAAPHAPATPAPRHATVPLDLPPFAPPSLEERGWSLADKPRYVRENWRWPTPAQHAFRVRQYRALLAVDDAVGRILDALAATGKLRDTMFVFTSDNGVMWNEHGFTSARKAVPYEGAIRAPMIVRYDARFRGGRTDARLVTNLDLAPTFAQLARVRFGSEGRSLVPLLRDLPLVRWRQRFLLENMGGEIRSAGVPTWCSVRTNRYTYTVYETGEQELYDLAADPFQLENAAGDDDYRRQRRALLAGLRRLCFPLPPGYQPRILCTARGTSGSDVIIGDRRPDFVCPLGGRDSIATGGGADTVHAGALSVARLSRVTWAARSSGDPGSWVSTGPGRDRAFVRNGRHDVVRCGPGRDTVFADRFDVVGRDCERVAYPSR